MAKRCLPKKAYYGAFGKAPRERLRLHTWALSKGEAEKMARLFKSEFARQSGWRNVQAKKLTDGQMRTLISKARKWTRSSLPKRMRIIVTNYEKCLRK